MPLCRYVALPLRLFFLREVRARGWLLCSRARTPSGRRRCQHRYTRPPTRRPGRRTSAASEGARTRASRAGSRAAARGRSPHRAACAASVCRQPQARGSTPSPQSGRPIFTSAAIVAVHGARNRTRRARPPAPSRTRRRRAPRAAPSPERERRALRSVQPQSAGTSSGARRTSGTRRIRTGADECAAAARRAPRRSARAACPPRRPHRPHARRRTRPRHRLACDLRDCREPSGARARSGAAVCAAARRARALYALARSRCTARTISCRYGIASRDLYMDIYYYYYYYYYYY